MQHNITMRDHAQFITVRRCLWKVLSSRGLVNMSADISAVGMRMTLTITECAEVEVAEEGGEDSLRFWSTRNR